MTSSPPKSRILHISRDAFNFGFELKDEVGLYKKFALVSKVTGATANSMGLKPGDKIIRINGIEVAGRDYVALRNNMRQSANQCVELEILNCLDSAVFTSRLSGQKAMPWDCSKHSLVPTGSIREKIRFFQNDDVNINNNSKNGNNQKKLVSRSRSNSCGCILESIKANEQSQCVNQINSSSLTSITNVMQDENSLTDLNTDIGQPVSQEPFSDDSISASCNIINVPITFANDRVMTNKPSKHIKDFTLLYADPVFESIPEPFESNTLLSPSVPKIEISSLQNVLSKPVVKLVPAYSENLSCSSINLCEVDITSHWQSHDNINQNHNEFASMTNIVTDVKKEIAPDKKLIKQASTIASIPIKLRILQFKERVRSKSWKEYIIERTETGVRFRKRLKSMKYDKANDFVIKPVDVNRFSIESPHKRQKLSSGSDIQLIDPAIITYELMTSDNHIHLKFNFNSEIFQDTQSSSKAHAIYNEIIDIFKGDSQKKNNLSQKISLPEPVKSSMHISQSYSNFNVFNGSNSSTEDYRNLDPRYSPLATMSFRSTLKSSAENISNSALAEIIPPISKNIFKQAIDKIKPEKKVKSYEVFTGTKAEFEEFKRQLESGNLPMELDPIDESGMNFNKYIYEVPRMMNNPKIPMIIYLCTEIVEKIGLQSEGIYRISGNQRVIRTLSNTLNKNLNEIDTTLPEWSNVHAVCGTLKLFLRKLKQNLIPADLSHVLAYSCKAVDSDDPISLSKTLMDIRYHLSSYQNSSRRKFESDLSKNIDDQLDCRWQTLQYLLRHLSKVVTYRRYNNMDEHALSVCFNPVVMESWQNSINDIKADNEIMIKALELILVHQDWLFSSWNPFTDKAKSTELMANAIDYAKKFIERKYDISLKLNQPSEIVNNDININKLILKIVSQATMDFGEKKRIRRRHSSHTPGQKPSFAKDEVDGMDRHFNHRNSKVADALDLSTCVSILRQIDKVPTLEENKKIKVTYISSTDSINDCDEKCELRKHGFSAENICSVNKNTSSNISQKSSEYVKNNETYL